MAHKPEEKKILQPLWEHIKGSLCNQGSAPGSTVTEAQAMASHLTLKSMYNVKWANGKSPVFYESVREKVISLVTGMS